MKYFLIIFIPFLSLEKVNATPEPSIHIREILLAFNDSCYFSYSIHTRNYGSYYYLTDSVFFNKIGFDGEVKKRTLLRTTEHRDTTANNEWKLQDHITSPISLDKILVEENATYLFPQEFQRTDYSFEKEGLFMQIINEDNGTRIRESLIEFKEIQKQLSWTESYIKQEDDSHLRIKDLFMTDDFFLFKLEVGNNGFDSNFYQGIVVIDKKQFNLTFEKLKSKIKSGR